MSRMAPESRHEGPARSDAEPLVSGDEPERWRFSRVTFNLTAANLAFAALAFITGPVLARALGASGRGDLAAILVPLHLMTPIAIVGMDVYAAREAARGRPVGTLGLSLGLMLTVFGGIVAVAGVPISAALAGDREVVRAFLLIGFALAPVTLLVALLVGLSTGLQRWRLVIAVKLVPGTVIAAALVVLFITDSLTVGTAAVVYLAAELITGMIVAPVLRHSHLRLDWGVMKEGISFGGRAWAGTLADLANARLDQLLMIPLVAPRELGLYAVAVSIGSIAWIVTGGISPPLLARISAGEIALAPRALRTVLVVLAAVTIVVAALTPVVLRVLFGPEFTDATHAAWILLAAGLPAAGSEILTQTLNGAGRPGMAAFGQGVALAITIPGLLILLPIIGIIGAALISLVAYSVNFLIVLIATMRICRMSARELLVPTRADLAWMVELVRSRLKRGPPSPKPS